MSEQEKQVKSEQLHKEALNALHHAKPSQNISILDTSKQGSEELLEKLHETLSFGKVLSVSEIKSEESNHIRYHSPEKMEQLNPGRTKKVIFHST